MESQHIIITGAGGNLGRALMDELIRREARISAIVSPSTDPGSMPSGNVKTYRADLLDEEKGLAIVTGITDGSGPVNGGVLTAGGFSAGTLSDTGLKDIHRMIDLNFTTAYNIARPLFRHMRSAGRGGKIIFIGARPVLQPVQAKDMVAYTFSKSLLLRLSEIINAQSDGTGIYSYVIVPGIIDTPRNRKSMPDADFSKWISAAEISRKIGSILSEPGSEPEDKIIPMYRGS